MEIPKKKISKEKLEEYIKRTETALRKAKIKNKISKKDKARFAQFKDFCERYLKDAKHFMKKGEWVTAFAALNYAHAWIDAAAISGWLDVKDKDKNKFFAMD